MNAAQVLTITAAAALLVFGDYARRQMQDGEALEGADWSDHARALASEALHMLTPSPVERMQPSERLRAMLQAGEAVRLRRYRLGDGGWTIGIGRYYKDGGPVPPESISLETAHQWFADDIENRGARWVRAYVEVPLMQHQFDALVHMAFNLSPKAFRTIAEAVNRGEDPEAEALRYVRAGTDLERGLRNRRAKEINLYRSGVYT